MPERDTSLPSSLRIIEVGGGAATYTTHFLAALGARVVKVEPPSGDPDRERPPFGGVRVRPGLSAHFLFFNANKESVVLDLSRPGPDIGVFRDLVRSADVLVDATGPDGLARVGCSYADLLAEDPGLVILAQTPFGLSGPHRSYLATGSIDEAMSGFAYPLGDTESPPIPSPNDFQLQVAGLHGGAYVIAALREVQRSGHGQIIDMSLQEVGTHMQGGVLAYGLKKTITRRARLGYVAAMQMTLPVSDGYVLVQPVFPAMWKAWTEWIGDPALDKPEYATPQSRLPHAADIEKVVVPFAQRFTVAEFVREAQQRRIPSSPINEPAALLESPQAEALGSFLTMTHPDIGSFKAMGYPVRLSKTPMAFRSPAPKLGEHQAAVLASLQPRAATPVPSDAPSSSGPLAGIRVLDFTHVLAGPTATQALGFLGAEIIKVETRNSGLEPREAAYAGLNRGKRGVTLDARTPDGKKLALQLAAQCDVVIDNFSAGVMGRLGLAYEDLKLVKPEIIAVSINGWGRGGPLSSWSAYGPTLQSYTGMYWVWRHEGAPFYQGVKQPPADFICAAQALLGIVAAVTHRERTGEGQFVELVMLEGLGHSLGPYYLQAVLDGQGAQLHGHRSARWAPSGRYRCSGDDAWCDIACETEMQWDGLRRAMGRPEWASRPAFATREGRLAAAAELDREIGAWTAVHPAAEVMRLLQSEGVPAGAIQNAEDVFNDPHLRARGHIVTTPNPAGGAPLEVEGMTARFSRNVCRDDAAAPQIGEHNVAVFGGLLGLSTDRIAELEEAKVLY